MASGEYRIDAERDSGGIERCYALVSDEGLGWSEGRSWKSPGFAQSDEHPVVCVSWDDAQKYIDWLNGQTGKTYRLPSEAEWEYAARGVNQSKYYYGKLCEFGNVPDNTKSSRGNTRDKKAGCTDGYFYTAPVGSYKGTWQGLRDMHGNAWEWVQDTYHDSYKDAPADGSVWQGGDSRRVLRGGGWNLNPLDWPSVIRYWGDTTYRYNFAGFRLAEDSSR